MTRVSNQLELVESAAARWTAIGAMFNVSPAQGEIDLEHLLLDTARSASQNERLFTMAVTWLASYGDVVDDSRLASMIRESLEREHYATLGLLLELAKNTSGSQRFAGAIALCAQSIEDDEGRPMADIENETPFLRQLSRGRASGESLRWGRWIERFEPKYRALRPVAKCPG